MNLTPEEEHRLRVDNLKAESPHFHDSLKCGPLKSKKRLIYFESQVSVIREAFCYKHQITVCHCGWEKQMHYGEESLVF